jgi:hypothetical protein
MTREIVFTPLVPLFCFAEGSAPGNWIFSQLFGFCSCALPLWCGYSVGTSEHHGLGGRTRRMIREDRIFSPLVLLSSYVPRAVPFVATSGDLLCVHLWYVLSVVIREHRGPGTEWR